MESQYRCAILGHHPMRFAWGFDEEAEDCRALKLELAQQIMVLRQSGVCGFVVACDCGIGLYAAEIINILREHDKNLALDCITPYEELATKWTPNLRDRYFQALALCSHLSAVDLQKTPDAQYLAYCQSIQQSDFVLAVYNAASVCEDDADRAIRYAHTQNKPVIAIHPDTLALQLLVRE